MREKHYKMRLWIWIKLVIVIGVGSMILSSILLRPAIQELEELQELEPLKQDLSNGTVQSHLGRAIKLIGKPPKLEYLEIKSLSRRVTVTTYLSHFGARGKSDMTCFSLQSMLAHGVTPRIHGFRNATNTTYHKGFMNKVAGIVALTAAYPRDTLLVIYDAIDVLMMRGDERLIQERYNTVTMGLPKIVVSTEKLMIAKMCSAGYPSGAYPNTGMWIGPAGLLHDLFLYLQEMRSHLMKVSVTKEDLLPTDFWAANDQKLFICLMQQITSWRENIVLDVRSAIFQTMFDGTRPLAMLNYDVANKNYPDSFFRGLWTTKKGEGDHGIVNGIWKSWFGHLRNLRMNTDPIFFHFPVVRDHILVAFANAPAWLPSDGNPLPPFRINGQHVDVPTLCCAGSAITFYKVNPFSVCRPAMVWIAKDVKRLVNKCKIANFTEAIEGAFSAVRKNHVESRGNNGIALFGNNYWAPRNYWAHSCDPPDFVRKVTLYVPAFSRVAWLDNVEQMYFSVFRGDDEFLLADQKTLDEYREKKASSKLLKDETRLKES